MLHTYTASISSSTTTIIIDKLIDNRQQPSPGNAINFKCLWIWIDLSRRACGCHVHGFENDILLLCLHALLNAQSTLHERPANSLTAHQDTLHKHTTNKHTTDTPNEMNNCSDTSKLFVHIDTTYVAVWLCG